MASAVASGVVEVAEHHVVPAQEDLARAVLGRGVDAQFELGDRSPARRGDGDRVVVGAAHVTNPLASVRP